MTAFSRLFAKAKTIIFDVDGTLVDSNDLHAEAWAKALNRFGKPLSAREIRPWIGMGGDKILHDLVGIDDQSTEGKAITDFRTQLFIETYAPRVQAFPAVLEFLGNLRSRGYATGIATSANARELRSILKASGLEKTLDWQTHSDDAEDSKPDPDIVQAALRIGKVAAENALMIGDTPYDVEASHRAGVPIIALRSGGWDDKALKDAELIVADIAALDELLKDLK